MIVLGIVFSFFPQFLKQIQVFLRRCCSWKLKEATCAPRGILTPKAGSALGGKTEKRAVRSVKSVKMQEGFCKEHAYRVLDLSS